MKIFYQLLEIDYRICLFIGKNPSETLLGFFLILVLIYVGIIRK